jgi:cytochrome c oxidase assembly protein subunit 15
VDEQVKVVGYDQMDMILQNPQMTFYFHRSFSIVVFLVNLFLLLRNTNKNLGFEKIKWVMWLLALEIVSGIAMAYFDFPFGSQTVHLVIASILFGTQFYMLLEYRNLRKRVEKPS